MIILLPLWILAVTAQTTDDGSRIFFENELPIFRAKPPSTQKPFKVEKEPNHNVGYRPYVSKALRDLSINLDSLIRKENPNKNTLFSPIPIANALGLLLLGATGRTANEISKLIGYNADFDVNRRSDIVHEELESLIEDLITNPGVSSNGSEISVGAAVFPNKWYGINNDYIEKAQNIYHSDVVPLDFYQHGNEAKMIINKWVANVTNNRITSIMENIPPSDISIVLASAIYFNCEWKYPFPTAYTKMGQFYTGNIVNAKEEFVNVPMMINVAEVQYFEDKVNQLQMMGLPYKGDEIFMYIVLPEGDLKQMLNQLKEPDLKTMIDSCKKRTAIYMMPRMKLEAELHLEDLLRQLGITLLFDPATAELGNIAHNAFVNEIIHKVEVEVTETGTSGSAATLVSTNRGGVPVVRVDKPFLFFIHHVKTDSFLFWGTVIKPTPHTSQKV